MLNDLASILQHNAGLQSLRAYAQRGLAKCCRPRVLLVATFGEQSPAPFSRKQAALPITNHSCA
jgi:hypothetical protein